MTCENCGKTLNESSKFCANCGKEQKQCSDVDAKKRSGRNDALGCVAALLVFILGVPSCIGGGCMLMFAPNGGVLIHDGASPQFAWLVFWQGMGLLTLFGALIYFFRRTNKKK